MFFEWINATDSISCRIICLQIQQMKNIDFHTQHTALARKCGVAVEGLMVSSWDDLWPAVLIVPSLWLPGPPDNTAQCMVSQLLLPFLFALSDPLSHQPALSWSKMISNPIWSCPLGWLSPLFYVDLDYVTFRSEPPLFQSKFWTVFWLLWEWSRWNYIPLPIMF